ncbi:MAG: GSCFA domain-containing protein [Calditrichaeota bacterium]|nr:GSCFA domain-containing protein [Calditrichota bacterium]
MRFRTELEVQKAAKLIEHSDKIITIGSCFAEHIAARLKDHYFAVLDNPFGVLYNPLSIANAVEIIIEKKFFKEEDLFFYQKEWHSFWHHSSFSHHDRNVCLQKINDGIDNAHRFLKQAKWIILTFGTAFVYYHLPERAPVANCHKLPEKQFERKLADVAELTNVTQKAINRIRAFNPHINLILTVSPIRHLRDGFVENQKSKATLILTVHQIVRNFSGSFYFPAYELLMDDLRDYRFYEPNLTHPNQLAFDYVWEKFNQMFFDKSTLDALKDFSRLKKSLQHKAGNPESPAHRQFLRQTLKFTEELEKKYPYVQLDKDKTFIEEQLLKNKRG